MTPDLPGSDWEPTKPTLQRYAQIVGKIRMAPLPFRNQSWHVTLPPATRGLSTGPVPSGPREVEVDVEIHAEPLDPGDSPAFAQDRTHASHDADAVTCSWRILVGTEHVLARFASRFNGEASPIQRFWRAPTDPTATLPTFYQSAYDAGAAAAHWDSRSFDTGIR